MTDTTLQEPREWLIRKNGYFYRPNRSGYTMEKAAAGFYTKAEADREAAIEPENFTVLHESEVPDAPQVQDIRAQLQEALDRLETCKRVNSKTLTDLNAQLSEALDRADRAETLARKMAARLEIDHHYVMDGDAEDGMRRVDIPESEWEDQPDGIEARDATIELIEGDYDRAIARATTAEAALEGARKVIEPFAQASRSMDAMAVHFGAELRSDDYKPKTGFTHGQLRAARQWLSANPEVKG